MDILQETRRILEQYGYAVSSTSGKSDEIEFEDGSLMGFVWESPTPGSILRDWQARQDDFLRRSAKILRGAEFKSWNLYAVLLTGASAESAETFKLKQVEEDFRAMRKITRAGLSLIDQLVGALYPFIPIQHLIPFDSENSLAKVRDRLDVQSRNALDTLLNSDDQRKAVASFLDSYENPKT